MNEHDKGQVAASAAEIYEQFFVPALFAEWPERALKAAGVQSGDRILDVACGTGVLARKAAEIVGSDCVVGVDINEGMLAVAEQKAPDISWRVGPAESLPFETDTFDRVFCQFGLMFFEDQTKALKEMGRVVRPGGTVGVTVWGRLEDTPGYLVVFEILKEVFGDDAANSIYAPYSLGDKARLTSLFTQADMDDISIQTITGSVRFKSVDEWMYTDIKGWTLASSIDDEGFERFKEHATKRLAHFVQADGSVLFDTVAYIVVASGK